jgi:putative Mn2+ efflux pump MntP
MINTGPSLNPSNELHFVKRFRGRPPAAIKEAAAFFARRPWEFCQMGDIGGGNNMGLSEIVLIALGLSMDAFAVSVALGLSIKRPKTTEIMLPAIYFGFFQALMPAAGYFSGIYFADKIQGFDHWIAFALLSFVGGKMIKDSLSPKGEGQIDASALQFAKMLALAVATSIDALAVGITFAVFKVNIFRAAIITGAITFLVSMIGVKAGNTFGGKFKAKAEFSGGAVLILLGIKIVAEHVF